MCSGIGFPSLLCFELLVGMPHRSVAAEADERAPDVLRARLAAMDARQPQSLLDWQIPDCLWALFARGLAHIAHSPLKSGTGISRDSFAAIIDGPRDLRCVLPR